MKEKSNDSNFRSELEAIFAECQKNINDAVKEYERDVHVAIETLKNDLSRIS